MKRIIFPMAFLALASLAWAQGDNPQVIAPAGPGVGVDQQGRVYTGPPGGPVVSPPSGTVYTPVPGGYVNTQTGQVAPAPGQ